MALRLSGMVDAPAILSILIGAFGAAASLPRAPCATAICIGVNVLYMMQMKSGSANQAASDFRGLLWRRGVEKSVGKGHRRSDCTTNICGCIL